MPLYFEGGNFGFGGILFGWLFASPFLGGLSQDTPHWFGGLGWFEFGFSAWFVFVSLFQVVCLRYPWLQPTYKSPIQWS